MSQLSFSFQSLENTDRFREEDFLLLPENSAAIAFLKKFFAQKDFTRAAIPSMILKGSKACGKTHLLHIFAKKFSLQFFSAAKISQKNFVNFFEEGKFYALEDINKAKDCELLLHAINSAFNAKAFLILTSEELPNFPLKDLNSRLKNIASTAIKDPSLESLKLLLANALSIKQIKLSRQVINFISTHINRTYEALFDALKIIENCSENGEKITMKNVRLILQKMI